MVSDNEIYGSIVTSLNKFDVITCGAVGAKVTDYCAAHYTQQIIR